jgi:hypothetical protein
MASRLLPPVSFINNGNNVPLNARKSRTISREFQYHGTSCAVINTFNHPARSLPADIAHCRFPSPVRRAFPREIEERPVIARVGNPPANIRLVT